MLAACGQLVSENNETSDFERKTGSYETMEDFGDKIFQLISKDQYKAVADLMPDLSEHLALLKTSALEEDEKERKMKQLESELKNDIESLKQSYDRFKEEAEKSGIDWTKSKLDFIDFKHERENKIEKADLFLNFKYKGVNYKIEIRGCYKFNDSWLMGNQINFKDKNYYDRYSSPW